MLLNRRKTHPTHLNHDESVTGPSAAFGILNRPVKVPLQNIITIRSCFTGRQTLIRFSITPGKSVNEFRSRDTSSVCEFVLTELGCFCRINAASGCDYWAQNVCAIMSGGGISTRQFLIEFRETHRKMFYFGKRKRGLRVFERLRTAGNYQHDCESGLR